MDINNAFLHGFLEEELYMTPPKGYLKAKNGEVCHLKKSLYGLKQASCQWNVEFTNHLYQFGFEQLKVDTCLFTYDLDKGSLILLVYVDDLLIAGSTKKLVLKQSLHKAFTIKDLGYAKFFLGLEVARSPEGIFVNQKKYVTDIVLDIGLSQAKDARTPLPPGLQLQE